MWEVIVCILLFVLVCICVMTVLTVIVCHDDKKSHPPENEDIKPSPCICGKTPVVIGDEVVCLTCEMRVSGDDREDAVNKWNTATRTIHIEV